MATPTETTGGAGSVLGTSSESPFGIEHVWEAGDFVTRGLMIVLIIMSAVSWWIMITKAWDQRRLRKQAIQAEKDFWSAGSIKQAVDKLQGKNNAFKAIAEEGVRATQHHEGRLTDQIDLHEWISQALQRTLDGINHHLQGGLPMLATIGSTAPFVGLLGTVWGILQALINIGIAGQFSIDKVAGPVGEALIMTAIGLFVAVPAVFGYNLLLRRNKVIFEKLKYFATDMHAYLLSGARVGGSEIKPRTGATQPAAARP